MPIDREAAFNLPSIEMPQAGRTLEGVGEKLAADPFTGRANLSIPLPLTACREAQPSVALDYDSATSNGVFGIGFRLALPAIFRNTRLGIPTYTSADQFVSSEAGDLVRTTDAPYLSGTWTVTIYRPQNEQAFSQFEMWTDASGVSYWRVLGREGDVSVYGETPLGRISDPRLPQNTWQWMIERTTDAYGNKTQFGHIAENRENVPPAIYEVNRSSTANRYPSFIKYGNYTDPESGEERFAVRVVFDYGQYDLVHPDAPPSTWKARPDPFSSYHSGFEIRTYRLCRGALTFHEFSGENGGAPFAVRLTAFEYDESPSGSFLRAVRQAGYRQTGPGDYETLALPPLNFEYTKFDPQGQRFRPVVSESGAGIPGYVSSQFIPTDLYAEGLPGFLNSSNASTLFWEPLGGGAYQRPQIPREFPIARNLTAGEALLTDVNGNGFQDLVVANDLAGGSYQSDPSRGWSPFRPFTSYPLDYTNPEIEFVDLEGDGRMDGLLSERFLLKYYPSLGEAGYGQPLLKLAPTGMPSPGETSATSFTGFADMFGDGLTHRVVVHNGSVQVWPNMGHGSFGAVVTFGDSPLFPTPLTSGRIRLADVDGDGLADLICIYSDRLTIYPNRSGNSFGAPIEILLPAPYDDFAQVSFFDITGCGTPAAILTRAIPEARHWYCDFTGGRQPYLLSSVKNNMGAVTALRFVSSTQFFLADKRAGNPWVTRLPSPVQVVDLVETLDEATGVKEVARFAYHEGYFDPVQRSFRGFGFVERWDTQDLPSYNQPGMLRTANFRRTTEETHVPAAFTKSWFHTGAYLDAPAIERQYYEEFWKGDPLEFTLADGFGADIDRSNAHLMRNAFAALAGRPIRSEVYGLDGLPPEISPLTVEQKSYEVRMEQAGEWPSFFVFERERMLSTYDRIPTDPRVQHDFAIEVDAYGSVVEAVTAYYPRRLLPPVESANPADQIHADQLQLRVTLARTLFANMTHPVRRLGVEYESFDYELGNLVLPPSGHFTYGEVKAQAAEAMANPIEYGQPFASGVKQARLYVHARSYYWNAAQTEPLPLSEISPQALEHHTARAVFPDQFLTSVYDGRVTPAMMTSTGSGGGGYIFADGYWWTNGATYFYTSLDGEFCLPSKSTDPFGGLMEALYDRYFIAPYQMRQLASVNAGGDVFLEQTATRTNYAFLLPEEVRDANGNLSQALFDPLGNVIVTSLFGHEGGQPMGNADLFTAHERRAVENFKAVIDNPAHYLQGASTFVYYDFNAWTASPSQPPRLVLLERTQWVVGAVPPAPDQILETVFYSDGLGRELETKKLAPNGWATSKSVIYNNKGKPVYRYLPFFTAGPDYQAPDTLPPDVAPPPFVIRYDAAMREIHMLTPKKFFTKTRYAPWVEKFFDQDDTVVDSEYYKEHIHDTDPAFADERNALEKAALFFDTPIEGILDNQGRRCLSVEINVVSNGPPRELAYLTTHVVRDIEGRPVASSDPRLSQHQPPIVNLKQTWSMTGQALRSESVDAGLRLLLPNANDKLINVWDGRGVHLMRDYDLLDRQISLTADSRMVERLVYGDSLPPADAQPYNLMGQIYRRYDQAGLERTDSYSINGKAMAVSRQLAIDYTTEIDWSDPVAVPLETDGFTTRSWADVLGCTTLRQTPGGSEYRPFYDISGMVSQADVTPPGVAAQRAIRKIDYDANRAPKLSEYGNGVSDSRAYEFTTNRLIGIVSRRESVDPLNPVLQNTALTYDPVGNLTRARDYAPPAPLPSGELADYTTDAIYRLLIAGGQQHRDIGKDTHILGFKQSIFEQIDPPELANLHDLETFTESYSYDDGNNLTNVLHQAPSVSWDRAIPIGEGNNRAYLGNGVDPEYDENGNLLYLENVRGMEWSYSNQLDHVGRSERSDGKWDRDYFRFDNNSQRVRAVFEHYDSAGVLAGVDDAVYLGHMVVYRRLPPEAAPEIDRYSLHVQVDKRTAVILNYPPQPGPYDLRYQLTDYLGSSVLETGETGELISVEKYYPFGGTAIIAGGSEAQVETKDYRYSGKEADDSTGLYDYGARFLPAWLGRWINPDPAGDIDGLNLYAFAGNNPLVHVDELGYNYTPVSLRVPDGLGGHIEVSGHRLIEEVVTLSGGLFTGTTATVPPQVGPTYQITNQQQHFQLVKNVLQTAAPNTFGVTSGGQTISWEMKADYQAKNPGVSGAYHHMVGHIDKSVHVDSDVASDVIDVIKGGPTPGTYGGKVAKVVPLFASIIPVAETFRSPFGGVLGTIELYNIKRGKRSGFRASFARGDKGRRSYFIGAQKGGAKALRGLYNNVLNRKKFKRERYYAANSLRKFFKYSKEFKGQTFASQAAVIAAVQATFQRKLGGFQG
ncbi:MAG TPA: SpvB/TcaC N-terminal domain-containing protein [Bryobacteraceae bacterium]